MTISKRTEFFAAIVVVIFILTLADLVFIRQALNRIDHTNTNGVGYNYGGFMQYTDPDNGKTLYLPFYLKETK